MAPELTGKEEEWLRALAGRLDNKARNGVLWQLVQEGNSPTAFLAEILLRTIAALEREDDYQRDQRERN